MEIKEISIKLIAKEDITAYDNENLCHIKSLPWLSVVQAKKGTYDIKINDGEEQNTSEGGFFIAPSCARQKITHHTNSENLMQMRWIFIDVKINRNYSVDTLFDFPAVIADEGIKEKMNLLFDELYKADGICDNMSVLYKIVKLLLEIASEKTSRYYPEMIEIINYIEENYSDNITVSKLASILNMSESNFFTMFKKCFGKSPVAYINDYRLAVAGYMLKNTNDRIGKIAEKVGIYDQLYFSRMFKNKYKVSPREYRKSIFN